MPNHCANRLNINGDFDTRNQFIATMLNKDTLDLNKVIPCDEYHIENWGTKWGCYNGIIIEHNENKTILQFMTAWNPYNINIQKQLSKLFPTLIFLLEYVERGTEIYGSYFSHDKIFIDKQDKLMCRPDNEEVLIDSQTHYQELFDISG